MNFGTCFLEMILFLLCIKYAYLYEVNSTDDDDDDDNYDDYDVNYRIIGGEDAQEIYPYLVSIQMFNSHYCGGSVIAPRWVLTAAHCLIMGMKSRSPRIIDPYYCGTIAGTLDLKNLQKAEYRYCRSLHVHPSYRFSSYYDIGMISLTEPHNLKLVDLAPTTMIENSLQSLQKTYCKVMGWGAWREDIKKNTNLLREVSLPLLSGLECKLYHKHGMVVVDMHLCTLENKKDACRGDSGGPLICNGYQYGLVSWGHGCARDKSPGVYTRVDYYNDWIRTVMSFSGKLTLNVFLLFVFGIIPTYFTTLFL